MSSFNVLVRRISVEPHPDPDTVSIEVGHIDGFNVVVKKGLHQTGDLVVYIPEGAVVPQPLLEEMDLVGGLGKACHCVVKPIKLRKVLSEGLVYRPATWPKHWVEGTDVTEELGFKKYEEPIPAQLRGDVERAPALGVATLTYTDIDNIKKNLRNLEEAVSDGEPIVLTEKIHGTCTVTVRTSDGETFVSSKGQAGKWLVIKPDDDNLYWKVTKKYDLEEKLDQVLSMTGDEVAILYSEAYGIQDLKYGRSAADPGLAAFDLKLKSVGYVDYTMFSAITGLLQIPTVPELYVGPYSKEVLDAYTVGNSTVKGAGHIREGVVVKPLHERETRKGERIAYKSINPKYLLRGGEVTEFN